MGAHFHNQLSSLPSTLLLVWMLLSTLLTTVLSVLYYVIRQTYNMSSIYQLRSLLSKPLFIPLTSLLLIPPHLAQKMSLPILLSLVLMILSIKEHNSPSHRHLRHQEHVLS